MPFVVLPLKSNGNNISRAEIVSLLDNLKWFRTPPAYRLYDADDGFSLPTTLTTLNWATGHYEWREGGGGDPNNGTYNSGTGGDYVNVGDVADGLWLNGLMITTRVTSNSATQRRFQLRRGTGSVWTILADILIRSDGASRRTAVHIHGVGTFNATTDRVEARGRSQGTAVDVIADRRWGVRLGQANSTPTIAYAAARQVSDTNNELRNTFNRIADNQLRMELRHSAQRYKDGSNQSIPINTATTVTMSPSDWSSHPSMVTTVNRIDIVHSGLYFVSAQVKLDGFANPGASFGTITIQSITGSDIVTATSANAPGKHPEATDDMTVTVSDLVQVNAGRYLRMQTAVNDTGVTAEASRSTQMHATLMSSNVGVSPNRQKFARMPPPAEWPNVAGMSSNHLPVGTLRVISDLTDRQWHRPAFKCSLVEDVEVGDGAGWRDVACDNVVFDYTNLEEEFGYRVFSRGGITLPWAGLWLVGARLSFSARTAEGNNYGAEGNRGMRIAYGDGRSVGAIVGRAMNASGHGWTRTIAETVVINRDEGLGMKLQGIVTGGGANDFGAAVVTSASLWAVELGEGITRVPR
jgi:hypothetical protein